VRSLMLEVGNGHGPIVRNKANYPKRATEAASRLRIVDWDCGSYIDLRRDASCGLAPRACAGRLYKQPEFPAGGVGRGPRGAGRRPIVQNKPNSARAPGKGRGRPGGPAGDQWRKTNPIARSGAPRWCRGVGRRVEYPLFQYSIIPPFHSHADCAKQTQFAATPRGPGLGERGANVRNKANSAPAPPSARVEWCQTNPIRPGRAAGRGLC
jgi:hypothetical protein